MGRGPVRRADRRTGRSRARSLLIAGGVGITPLRALFETLPGAASRSLYRARTAEDLALGGELEDIARWRGRPSPVRGERPPTARAPELTAGRCARLMPDMAEHDVYLCGPPGMARDLYEALRAAGVPDRRIHHESFEM